MRAVALVLALASCAAPPRGPAAPPDAAALYRSKCAACHRLRDPGERDAEAWARAIERYGPRAHLAPEERLAILGFLQANAKGASAPEARP
jgi:cytochrome c5